MIDNKRSGLTRVVCSGCVCDPEEERIHADSSYRGIVGAQRSFIAVIVELKKTELFWNIISLFYSDVSHEYAGR